MTDQVAAGLGLRIEAEPYPNGIAARAVYRGAERIYQGGSADVHTFLQGYAAAVQAHRQAAKS